MHVRQEVHEYQATVPCAKLSLSLSLPPHIYAYCNLQNN